MRLPTKRLFWAVSLGHMANDLFMSMRSVVLTFLSAYVLPMSSQQIGFAVSAIELSGAISQPFFGRWADKTGGRWLGAGGVAWTVGFILLGLLVATVTGNFLLMVIPLALAGLGSGAFHPVGSMHAAEVEPLRAGRNAALFFMFGQTGLALGPALAGLLLNSAHSNLNDVFGTALRAASVPLLERGTVLPVFGLVVLAIPAVALMVVTLPNRQAYHSASRLSRSDAPRQYVPVARSAFVVMAAAVAFRSLAHLSTVNFMPYMFQAKGWTPAEYGFITSTFWMASGVAGVWFGSLGDRYDARRVILLSLLVAVPAVFLLPSLNGLLAVGAAIVIGATSGSHSLIVVMTQNMLPGRKGFASGAALGYIFASAAVSNLIVGSLIDSVGTSSAYHIIAGVTLVTSVLWLLLPSMKRPTAPATTTNAVPAAS